FDRVASAQTLLTASECQELYQSNPAWLEIREFVVKHALKDPVATPDSVPSSPTLPLRLRAAPAIPTASLRDIANSLLEEGRFEEGVRLLTTVGSSSLIQNAKVLAGLLAIFKPTHMIERALEKRSQHLLQSMGIANVDYSQVWKVDNHRRRAISQSQQRVLTYLASVNVQFVKPWFDDVYSEHPGDFFDYLDELTALPHKTPEQAVDERDLELELYQNRMTLACMLLEQMCADFASNMANLRRSMFLKVVYQGTTTITRLAYPLKLVKLIWQHFAKISFRRCPLKESKLCEHLLDMTTIAGTCDHLAQGNCAHLLVKHVYRNYDAELLIKFVDLVSSDTMAMDMIDYVFVSWFRFAALPGGRWTLVEKNLVGMPPSAAKTAFCLRHVRPRAKAEEDPKHWQEVVCLLAKLVQRSVSAYGRRMCRANCGSQLDASLNSDYPRMMLVASSRSGAADMANSYRLLREYLEAMMPRPSAEDVLNDDTDAMDCGSSASDSGSESSSIERGPSRIALLNMIYMDLDQIDALLSWCTGGSIPGSP
ncbi:hypothetical protein IWW47_004063, partial [Coemansia sp. RSA 2052]